MNIKDQWFLKMFMLDLKLEENMECDIEHSWLKLSFRMKNSTEKFSELKHEKKILSNLNGKMKSRNKPWQKYIQLDSLWGEYVPKHDGGRAPMQAGIRK